MGIANSAFYPQGPVDMGRCFPTLFCRRNLDNLRIMLADGRPVALAGFTMNRVELLGARLRFACLGAVSTLQEYRGRGLASRLVADAVAKATRLGAQVILISGRHGLYRRLGFIDAGLYFTARIGRGQRLPQPACSVRECTVQDLPALLRLHRGEEVRFLRSASQLRAFLEARLLFCRPSRIWLASAAAGQPLAYLCAQEPVAEEGLRVLKVLEIAGSRQAMLAALPRIFALSGADRIDIDGTAADAQLRGLAGSYGIPVAARGFHGTVKIVDRRGFLRSILAHSQRRLSRNERAGLRIAFAPEVCFRFGGALFRLSTDQELTAFAFGSVEQPAPAPSRQPLQDLLARIFPLPLVDYGLNYI